MGSVDIPPFLQKKMKEKMLADKANVPPFVKKKEDGEDLKTSSEIPTITLSASELETPSTSQNNFTEDFISPLSEINRKRAANSVNTKSQILGKIEIKDENIPANIMDKAGYRQSLQRRLDANTPDEIDLQVIATTTKKPVEAVKQYAAGKDGKGVMVEFDTNKTKKETVLKNLIEIANGDLGLNDTFESVFTSPETAKAYLEKIQKSLDQKTERQFNALNTVEVDGKKITLDEESERFVDRRLPEGQRIYNKIKESNETVVGMFKNEVGQSILQQIQSDNSLTYDQKVKKAGNLVYGKQLKQIEDAKTNRIKSIPDGLMNPIALLGNIFRDDKEETRNLNSVNAAVETNLNKAIKENIIYSQAKLTDLVQEAADKAKTGELSDEEKTNIKTQVDQLQSDIESKQKEYKSPQKLREEYPILLKQSLINDINEFNAIKSGNVKGYEDAGYENITLEEHLKAQGYDLKDQVVQDVFLDALQGKEQIKDYSFFGSPAKAIKDVFTSSLKSLGDITGVRDDVTILSEKTAGEMFPTTVGSQDELQLTETTKVFQNIGNTTGQVIGQGLMQAGTAGVGRMAGLSKVAAANMGFWSSGALTSYDQAYKDSFDFIDSDTGRTAYAGLIALANAASEKIFPEAKIFNIPGVKDSLQEIASKVGTKELTEKLTNQLLTKAKNAFIDYGEKYAKNVSKETLEETATSLFESGARYMFGDPNMNTDQAIEAAKNTAIQTAIGTSLIGGFGAHKDVQQEKSISAKSVIYNAAVYHDEAMDALNIGFEQGLYDQAELNNKVALLNTAQVGLSELEKAEKVIGRELTRPQKELYVANVTAQKLLREEKKDVENTDVLAKIDEKLANLNNQQTQLLDNKVQIDDLGNVVVPKAEVVVEETVTETPLEIVNSLKGNENIPAFELTAMVADPETALQTIADQALGFGRDEQGNRQPLTEGANEPQLEATERKFGKEVVAKAIAMFPAENISSPITNQNEESNSSPVVGQERLGDKSSEQEQSNAIPNGENPQRQPKEEVAQNTASANVGAVSTITKDEETAIKKWLDDEYENLEGADIEDGHVSFDWDGKILEVFQGRNKPPLEFTKEELIEKGVSFPTPKAKEVKGVAFHGITKKDAKSKGIYLADEELAKSYGEGEVEQYDYTLNNPLVVSKDTDFEVVNGIIDAYVKENPEAKFHPDITNHVNNELEKLGYDGLVIKQEALETEKGYEEIGGTYGEPQIVVFDRKNVSKIEEGVVDNKVQEKIKSPNNRLLDDNGDPIKLYHKSDKLFGTLKKSKSNERFGSGVYLSFKPEYKGDYTYIVNAYTDKQFKDGYIHSPDMKTGEVVIYNPNDVHIVDILDKDGKSVKDQVITEQSLSTNKEIVNEINETKLPDTPTETVITETDNGETIPPTTEEETEIFAEDKRTILSHRGLQEIATDFEMDDVTPRDKVKDLEELQAATETIDAWVEDGSYGQNIAKIVKDAETGEALNTRQRIILEQHIANVRAKTGQIREEKGINSEEYAKAFNHLNRLVRAGETARSTSGAALRITLTASTAPPTVEDWMVEEVELNKQAPLTDAQKENVQKEFTEISEAEKAYKDKIAELENKDTQKESEEVVKKVKATAKKTKKTHEDYVTERKKIEQSISEKLKKARGELSVTPIPYAKELFAIAPDVTRLMKSYVEEGVSKLGEIVTAIQQELKAYIPDIQEQDVHDIIAGNYNPKRKTKNEIAATIFDLKEQAKLINKLSNLVNGIEPANERQKIKRNQEIEDLRQKIKDFGNEKREAANRIKKEQQEEERLIREFEKEQDKNEKARLKAAAEKQKQVIRELEKKTPEEIALQSFKTRTVNNIKQLEEDLKTGNFDTPVAKPPIKLDKEALDLKDKMVKLKMDRQLRIIKQQQQNLSKWEKAQKGFAEVLNVPRTLMTILDYSAVLRQGIVQSISHPSLVFNVRKEDGKIKLGGAGVDMIKAGASQKMYDRWFFDLKETPRFTLMEQSGLGITDSTNPLLSAREEGFMSSLAEKIPLIGKTLNVGGVKIPGTNLVKGSERSYSMFLNKLRVDVFNRFADAMQERGLTFENSPEAYKQMADYVNNSTGRGNVGQKLNKIAPLLNSLFFSPRLIASRLNMLTYLAQPRFYKTVPKEVREAYFKDMGKFIGLGMLVLGLFSFGGGDEDDEDRITVETDPRSSDFGKIRQGNTRWDIWGGFQQYIRVAAQALSGKAKSSTTGNVYPLGGERVGRGQGTWNLLMKFGRGKLAPVPAMAIDLLSGENTLGDKVLMNWGGKEEDKEITIDRYLKEHLLPLTFTGTQEALKDQGVKALFTVGIPNVFGIGTQTYSKPPKKD